MPRLFPRVVVNQVLRTWPLRSRLEEELSHGVVCLPPLLTQLRVTDRVAVDAPMWAGIVLANILRGVAAAPGAGPDPMPAMGPEHHSAGRSRTRTRVCRHPHSPLQAGRARGGRPQHAPRGDPANAKKGALRPRLRPIALRLTRPDFPPSLPIKTCKTGQISLNIGKNSTIS